MESPAFTAIGIPARRCIVGNAAPQFAAVLDVVVHEKCVVQHFQARGGREARPPHRPPSARAVAMHSAGRRPLPDRPKKSLHKPIEMPLRLPRRNARRERVVDHVAVPIQALEEARRPHDAVGAWQSAGGDVQDRRLRLRQISPATLPIGRAQVDRAQVDRARSSALGDGR